LAIDIIPKVAKATFGGKKINEAPEVASLTLLIINQ
jgi:hypothetical protein